MEPAITITDDSIKWVIYQMVERPLSFCFSVAFLFTLFLVYKERVRILSSIKYLPVFRKKKVQLGDLLNHPLFKDLDFYIKEKINQLYDPDVHSKYDPIKLEIGRDLLKIKISNDLVWIKELVTKTDFNDPYLNIRALFLHRREKCQSLQFSLYKEQGIPLLFIEKFLEVTKVTENYLIKSIDDLLSDKIPLNIYEKVYMVLGNLSSYFSTILSDMVTVISSINGDLNGLCYKGKVIGGKNFKTYPVPDKAYIPLVREKLKEITELLKASRTSICVFHDVEPTNFINGSFSKIYEYESYGFTPAFNNMQYRSNIIISDLIQAFKQHEGFKALYTTIKEPFCTMLKHNGSYAFYSYPIYNNANLLGFIFISFHSLENYKELDEGEVYAILKKESFLLNHYLVYPEDHSLHVEHVIRQSS